MNKCTKILAVPCSFRKTFSSLSVVFFSFCSHKHRFSRFHFLYLLYSFCHGKKTKRKFYLWPVFLFFLLPHSSGIKHAGNAIKIPEIYLFISENLCLKTTPSWSLWLCASFCCVSNNEMIIIMKMANPDEVLHNPKRALTGMEWARAREYERSGAW